MWRVFSVYYSSKTCWDNERGQKGGTGKDVKTNVISNNIIYIYFDKLSKRSDFIHI